MIKRYRRMADRFIEHKEANPRVRLTAGQHILHLLLTLLTFGLWLPVWIFRALRGNPAPPSQS
ncbi:MAG TPA: hypothetical protein VIV12_23585 [Streptosporangiaceae bacterium]